MSLISTVRGFGNFGPIYVGLAIKCSGRLGSGVGAGAVGTVGGAVGGSTSSGELGTLAVDNSQPINRFPPEQVTLLPPEFVFTVPGPNICVSYKPVYVGGITPCAIGGSGIVGSGAWGGLGYGALSQWTGGYLGRSYLLGLCGSICQ